MRGVDLAIYADALAGEAASLAARAERARSRLRQAAIEKRARQELTGIAVERLQVVGVLGSDHDAAARADGGGGRAARGDRPPRLGGRGRGASRATRARVGARRGRGAAGLVGR